jgi:DNA-binding GntR family transcriptional regulator
LNRPATAAARPDPAIGNALVGREVTEYIRDLIVSGEVKAGDRLRVEHLAGDLSISVTPVREALVELLSEGFVERRPRRGYVVAELTRKGFEDRVLVLAMITAELAARAAARIGGEEVAALRELQWELSERDHAGDRAAAEKVNHRLHGDINLCADSPELAWIAQRSTRYVPSVTRDPAAERPRTCSYDHAAVIDALAIGDGEAARAAMFEHLIDSGKELARAFDGKLWPAPD